MKTIEYPTGTTVNANNAITNTITHEYRWSNTPNNGAIASLFDITYSNDWRTQLFAEHTGSTKLYVRSRYNGTTWGSWRALAFTDSNVYSATKLQTSRTIWGQSFNGTGNVSGDMTGVGSITGATFGISGSVGQMLLYNNTSKNDKRLTLYPQSNYAAIYNITADGSAISDLVLGNNSNALYYDASAASWGIGTSSPAYKLDVAGTLRATGRIMVNDNTVWHAGNDGSDSGLDADLLDGYQGSNYLRSFWTNQPGYDASQYVNDSFSTFTYSNNAPYTGPLFHLGASGYGGYGGYGVYFNTAYTYDSPLAYKRHGSNGDGGMGEWQYLARTSDLTWSNISGKPSSYNPASHTHPISQITNRGTLTFTGAVTGSYDGSGNLTINIPSGGMTSVNWNDIDGKPSTFTPSDHNHAWLSGWSDTRSVVETPNSYNSKFEVVGIKNSSTYGISSGTYVQVLGFRGWSDSSGGNAHELAFADNGRIFHRDGATTSWNAWDTVAYTSDLTWNSISGKPSTFTPASHNHSASNITSGTLPIDHGGTGASTAAGALTNLGITATATELNYVAGVTTAIQKQLDAKSDIGHTHNINEITNIHVVDTLPSSPISGDLYFVY